MRKIVIMCSVVCSMISLCSCTVNDKQSEKNPDKQEETTYITAADRYVPDEPEDSVLDFWIAENVEGVDFENYDRVYGLMGGREYLGTGYKVEVDEDGQQVPPEQCISYVVTAYPDYADGGWYVTRITITDPEVKVYGISMNSSLEEFDKVFEEMGYLISEVGDTGKCHKAEKDGVWFSLFEGLEFDINAEVSNREGIIF